MKGSGDRGEMIKMKKKTEKRVNPPPTDAMKQPNRNDSTAG